MKITYDRIGVPINVGSIVFAPQTATTAQICRVIKITPKMATIMPIEKKIKSSPIGYTSGRAMMRAHNQLICLDECEELVLYLMTQSIEEK
jgi:hypothetical protein